MIYNNLIENTELMNLFKNYSNKNLPHSFIFYGNKGTGKFGHAIEFSNLILSKNDTTNKISNKIKNNLHENINYILPLPKNRSISKNDSALKALTKTDLEEIHTKIQSKLNNPYYDIEIEKANTILINSIRDIKKKINLSNYNNQYNIYIILNAEKLCYPRSESANSLLKILEEPNEKNLFILVTSNISKMLDTLTSRCVKIYFPKLDNKQIFDFLKNEYNNNDDDIDSISHLCNGNMTFAIELLNDFKQIKENFKLLIDLVMNYNPIDWENFSSILKDKKRFKTLLKLFSMFLMDCIDDNNNIKCKIFMEEIRVFSDTYKLNNIYKTIDIINDTEQNIDKNLFMPLLITTFYIEIFQTLNKN